MNQNRWKSPVVWAAVVAQGLTILLTLGVITTGLSEALDTAIAGALQILTILGVLNNPTDGENF